MGWQDDAVVSKIPAWSQDEVVQEAAPPKIEQPNTWGQAIKNVAQGGAHLATGYLGSVAGDVAGLVAIPADILGNSVSSAMQKPMPQAAAGRYAAIARRAQGGVSPSDPTTLSNAVSGAITYTPKNTDTLSMNIASAPGKAMGWAGEKLEQAANGVPGLQMLPLRGLPVAAANAVGLKAARVAGRGPKPVLDPVPTTADLKSASRAAYKDAKDAGIVVPAKSYEQALSNVRSAVNEVGVNEKLHPKTAAILEEFNKHVGKDLTLTEAENLRRLASEVEAEIDPATRSQTADAFRAGKIVDALDESIDQLSANDPARELWKRASRSQMIDQAIERAQIKSGATYTQSGMENALRKEFQAIALNPKRMKYLTEDQKAAIKKVAQGGPLENSMRALGKFDPTTGGMASLVSLGTGGLLSSLTGGAGALILPAGFAGKRIATRMTAKNVDAAREALVGRGLPSAATTGKPGIPAEVAQALIGKSAMRSPAEIQADIQRAVQRAGAVRGGPASESARSIWLELERLQAELKAAEQRAQAQGAPSAPQNQ